MSIILIVVGQPTPLPAAPTLLLPENGSYEDLSGTPSFEWTYNAGDPSSGTTQTNYEFVLIINGGATLYWNATEEAFQSSPIWNTGTTTDTDPTFTLTFPSAAFTDGDNYQWAVASEDVNGQGPLSGYFTVTAEALPTVTVTAPTGTITSSDPIVSWSVEFPTGATQIAYRMAIYDAATYNQPGFEPGGTVSPDPNAVYDTGVVGSASGTSVNLESLAVYLPNNTQYRAYVQVTETGSLASDWAYSPFTVSYTPPNTPTVTISQTTDPDTGYPVIEIVVQGEDNLLAADDADPTLGIGTWKEDANCTVSSTVDGLQMVSTAAGTMSAETATGTGGYAVQGDTEYTVVASFQAGVTGRTCSVAIAWYNSAGAPISTSTAGTCTDNTVSPTQAYSTVTSPSQAVWATVVVSVESVAAPLSAPGAPTITTHGTAGSTHYYYKIVARDANGTTAASTEGDILTGNATLGSSNYNIVTWSSVTDATGYDVYRGTSSGAENVRVVENHSASPYDDEGGGTSATPPTENTSGEVHDVTEIGIFLGDNTTWGPGGFVGLQDVVLLRSDGLYVRGASIVNPAPLDAVFQQLEASTWGDAGYIDDYECVQHTEYTYEAQVIVVLSPNNSVLSGIATSNEVDFVVSITGGSFQSAWWTIVPTNPSTAANATISSWQPSSTRQATAHPVTGMTTMNVVSDTQLQQDFTGTYETFADSIYDDLEALIASGATVFVSSPWGASDSGYFSIGPAPGGLSSGTGVMTKDATLNPSVYGAGHRQINITAISQQRPSV